ncbi:MAG: hypothetical protein AAF756_22330 [Pseudomonadota bacterium]
MGKWDFWRVVTITGSAIVTLIAVLGIWGVIDGISALKIYFTLFLIAGFTAFSKRLIENTENQSLNAKL